MREVPPLDTVPTFPGGDHAHRIAIVSDGTTVTDINFGNEPVEPTIVDDGDDDFRVLRGQWDISLCRLMYQGDAHYLCDTTAGENAIVWEFTDLTPGATYRVSTSFVAGTNRTTDAPFTVSDNVTSATVIVDQTIPPAARPGAFSDAGTTWMDLVPAFTVTGDTLTVELTDDHSGGCIVGDAVRIAPVSLPEPAAPTSPSAPTPFAEAAVAVFDDGTQLRDMLSTVDWGSVDWNHAASRMLIVENPSAADSSITLGHVWLDNDRFRIVTAIEDAVLDPGDSVAVELEMDTATVGPRSANLGLYDQEGRHLFAVVLAGEVRDVAEPAGDAFLVDDGDSGFDEGGFHRYSGRGFQEDMHFSRPN